MKLTGVKVVCYEVVITLPDGVDKAKCEGGQDVEGTWVGGGLTAHTHHHLQRGRQKFG